MKDNCETLFAGLQAHYTPAEAKAAIDAILLPYGEDCKITFREKDAEIVDSFLVNSREDRHLICEIIHRTGLTGRSYENLAAEWRVHNASYQAGVFKRQARDVSLDYDGDPRAPVLLATEVFDALDIE